MLWVWDVGDGGGEVVNDRIGTVYKKGGDVMW